MAFRDWIEQHAGQSTLVEWKNWSSTGAARVLLVGFDEAAERARVTEVLLALLQELDGTRRTGFRQTMDGTIPIRSLASEISRMVRDHPGSEVVWLGVPYLRRIQAGGGDSIVCSVCDRFEVHHDDPSHADHNGLACPLHDEPRWRNGRTSDLPSVIGRVASTAPAFA